ncbi:MAG: hypothetical protein KIG74_03970 [Clostridiaceae bacterium]|nr:hypothetical protein [Clostridiaceae bacterium]
MKKTTKTISNKTRSRVTAYLHAWLFGEEDIYEDVFNREERPLVKARRAMDDPHLDQFNPRDAFEMRAFQRAYNIAGIVVCVVMIVAMLVTVSWLPRMGAYYNPNNNEVSERYIEKGMEETGAVNIVAGMILDYRAFDTFGESCVLFSAVCCVFILLKNASSGAAAAAEEDDRIYEPKNDVILQRIATVLVPFIMLFGIYIMFNGHLSAGGGFAGGAVLGAGMILYLLAFGFEKTSRFLNEKVVNAIVCTSLTFYCLAKSYSFYTGANGLHSIISKGTPGDLISAGLILPLNIAVGFVVACTMYSFYAVFRKGGM